MKRYYILDDIRGLAVISMVLYHLTWDIVYLAGVKLSWYEALPGRLWQRSICLTFILLSGFCWSLGRRHGLRGLTVFLGGLAVTAATASFMPENVIVFGILTLLGSCMLLMIPLEKLARRVPAPAGLVVSAALFALLSEAENGTAAFGLVRLPAALYRDWFTAYLGFPQEGFFSADYYPLIPWIFLFTAGYFLYRIFERHGWLRPLERRGLPPLEWTGRHAFEIYLIHQPVLALFFYIGGYLK